MVISADQRDHRQTRRCAPAIGGCGDERSATPCMPVTLSVLLLQLVKCQAREGEGKPLAVGTRGAMAGTSEETRAAAWAYWLTRLSGFLYFHRHEPRIEVRLLLSSDGELSCEEGEFCSGRAPPRGSSASGSILGRRCCVAGFREIFDATAFGRGPLGGATARKKAPADGTEVFGEMSFSGCLKHGAMFRFSLLRPAAHGGP